MCIKAGSTEMDSMKALMAVSLSAIIADVFRLDPQHIAPQLRLSSDLHMTARQQARLCALVAEYFDGAQLDFTPATTLGDLFERVVDRQFAGVPSVPA